jgi:hypothetical protein
MVGGALLILVLGLLGCSLKWGTYQQLDVFSRDHTSHETNASESLNPKVNKSTKPR